MVALWKMSLMNTENTIMNRDSCEDIHTLEFVTNIMAP